MGEEFVSDDEFHETFEDITSTSSSDSAGEGSGRDMRTRSTKVAPLSSYDCTPVWTSSSFQSKFSVWKDDPGSINERRQRFFKQMGIRNVRDGLNSNHATSLVNGFTSSDETWPKTARNSGEEGATETGAENYVKPTCKKCGGLQRSLDTQNSNNLEALRLEETVGDVGRDYPVENGCNYDAGYTLGPENEAPKKEPGPKTSDFVNGAQKACDCLDFSDTTGVHNLHGRCRSKPKGIPNKVCRRTETESHSPSPLDATSRLESDYQHRGSSSQEMLLQSYEADGGFETSSQEGHYAFENIMEERLKIRDLDSGKEFLINRFNRDGSLDMLRELDTGKELTLAEFEKALGLYSPVTQELKRRQLLADGKVFDTNPEVESTSKTSGTMKRKTWLRKLKGALSVTNSKEKGRSARSDASLQNADDTDASSLGGSLSREGSPKGGNSRDSSFAGLDRNEFTKPWASGLPSNDTNGSFWRKPQKLKVKLRQKSTKELSDLHMSQELLAHQGAIWTMKFSPDGRYLASAGQDRVVHVWEIVDHPLMAESDIWDGLDKGGGELGRREGSNKFDTDGSVKAGQNGSIKDDKEGSTKGGKGTPRKQKSGSKGPVPKLFWISEKPLCTFRGHTDDILDLSWSKSQFLLSSSMDKTVRLWHISYEECLRIFSHNDYVTCAEFNPLDDRFFLSGSLDDKVRIWSIPSHHVVDWSDIQEMVTAVCYTPDGKKAIVGSYKGTCRFYNATGNKLQLVAHIDVRDEDKKARGKKITGLHCMPGDPGKVLVTSNDSRVRVYDGLDLVAKYKGLRNVKSQISASFCPTGDFIISASEDSRVLVWNSCNRDISTSKPLYRRDKQLSSEEFSSRHVSVAIAWPESSHFSVSRQGSESLCRSDRAQVVGEPEVPPPREEDLVAGTKGSEQHSKCPSHCLGRSPLGIFGSGRKISSTAADELTSTKQVESANLEKADSFTVDISPKVSSQSPSQGNCEKSPPHLQRCPSFFPESGPKGSATWPEEKLASFGSRLSAGPVLTQSAAIGSNMSVCSGGEATPVMDSMTVSAAWGLVIVTAGLGGDITTFQNYGFPVRL